MTTTEEVTGKKFNSECKETKQVKMFGNIG